MASLAFPSLAKRATLSDGTTYGYVAVAPSDPHKPTFLLLHGYPSSSYDWRHQIHSLSTAGFGVIAPDLLGYGDTDAPADPQAYRMSTMSRHMADILDQEGVSRCIAVGHDWGAGLLSRVVTYLTDRVLGAIFVSVGYLEPGLVWDIEAFVEASREAFGYDVYGYWLWHNTEGAIGDCEAHPASEFSLLYPTDPEDWKRHFAPVGKAAEFVRGGQIRPLPSWYDLAEYTTHDRIMAIKGYRGPLNWYKAAMRGVNIPDEASVVDEEKYCKVPTLLIAGALDFVTRADAMSAKTKEWVKGNLRIETLDCGHWVQLERPEKVQSLFADFADQLTAKA